MKSFSYAALIVALVACSGPTEDGSRSKPNGGATTDPTTKPPPAATPTSPFEGTWDVNAFSSVLATGKNGQITIKGGEISGEIPTDPAVGGWEGCHAVESRIRWSFTVTGESAVGTITGESKYEGADCGETKTGVFESDGGSISIAAHRADRPTGKGIFDGKWEVTSAVDHQSPIKLTIDGAKFTAVEAQAGLLTGAVVGDRVAAKLNGFEFAAQRR